MKEERWRENRYLQLCTSALCFSEMLQISLVFLWNIATKNEEVEPLLTTPSTLLANYYREMKCISQEWNFSTDRDLDSEIVKEGEKKLCDGC